MDKIKKHHETTKMFMNRVEIGKDGKQEEKDRKLFYLTNGSSAFCCPMLFKLYKSMMMSTYLVMDY